VFPRNVVSSWSMSTDGCAAVSGRTPPDGSIVAERARVMATYVSPSGVRWRNCISESAGSGVTERLSSVSSRTAPRPSPPTEVTRPTWTPAMVTRAPGASDDPAVGMIALILYADVQGNDSVPLSARTAGKNGAASREAIVT
jgi:hypothetical protein